MIGGSGIIRTDKNLRIERSRERRRRRISSGSEYLVKYIAAIIKGNRD